MHLRRINLLLGSLLLGAGLLLLGNLDEISGMWHRNLGMVLFAKQVISQESLDRSAEIVSQFEAIQSGAHDLLLQSRRLSIQSGAMPHQNRMPAPCDDDYSRFAAVVAEPVYPTAGRHRQIYLSVFEEIGGAHGTVKFVADEKNRCQVVLSAMIDKEENRYLTLSAQMPVQPDTTYRLSAKVRLQGELEAWFGIKSRWQEMKLPARASNWQNISYTFHTSNNATTEVGQVLVTDGTGSIEINDVLLERIP